MTVTFTPTGVGGPMLQRNLSNCTPQASRIVVRPTPVIEGDLRERVVDLGYGPDSDLSRLAHYQLANLPPLDTARGGDVLIAP